METTRESSSAPTAPAEPTSAEILEWLGWGDHEEYLTLKWLPGTPHQKEKK